MTDNIQRTLGRIEGKIDGINQRLDNVDRTLINYNNKINLLETFRDNLQGRMTIIGAIAGFLGALITTIINRFIKQ